MVFNIALWVSVLAIGCMSVFVLISIKVGEDTIRHLWRIFVIAFSVMLYFNEPAISTDLWRHYYCMDEIRNGIIPTMYGAEVGFIAILWILTKIGKNYLLPSVVFFITGMMIDKIYGAYRIKNEYKYVNQRVLICYYMLSLSGLNIFYVISGIRTAVVCVFFVWTYIKFYEKNRKWYYIIMISLGTIHIMSFMLLVLVAVNTAINKVQRKGRILTIFIIAVIGIRIGIQSGVIAFLAGLIPGEIGNLLYRKILDYSISDKGITQLSLILNYAILLFVLLLSLIKERRQNTLVYMLFLVSLLGGLQETVQARLVQAASLLAIPNLNINYMKIKGKFNHIYFLILYFACLFSCFFSFYSLCAHTILNGTNYRDILADFMGL